MPIYSFRCRSCGEYKDIHRNFDDTHEETCDCGEQMRKVFALNGVTFRGNGFYRTDSQTNKPKED